LSPAAWAGGNWCADWGVGRHGGAGRHDGQRLRDPGAGRRLQLEGAWGTGDKLLLNKHPYADAMIADIQTFKALTGISVTYDIFPEDVYFDKVTAALSSRSAEYDVFMTGAYQTWQYGPAGRLVDLNEYIKDPAKTNPAYNWDDILPAI
jgi:hypothetical protein